MFWASFWDFLACLEIMLPCLEIASFSLILETRIGVHHSGPYPSFIFTRMLTENIHHFC